MHRMEVYISRGAAGKESTAFVGRMSDEKALEMAAKVVSEGFVFSVSSRKRRMGWLMRSHVPGCHRWGSEF